MSTDQGDKNKTFSADEILRMSLIIKMGGSKFRWECFKMAYEMSYNKSFDRVVNTANEIIDWVNETEKIEK